MAELRYFPLNQKPSRHSRYLHKKTNNTLWALTTISLIRDFNRKPLFFIAQVQDITQRKKFEKNLKI